MKKIRAFFYITAIALGLNGCATPYGSSAGNALGGFSEAQLGENMFQVSFKGNAYSKPDTVANYTLLRSAELTLQNGFSHFIVVDKADLSTSGSYTTPVSSSTTSTATARISGNNISGIGSSSTQYYGGQTFSYRKPGASNTIVCFKGEPQVNGVVYDAAFLVKSLKSRYQIPSSSMSSTSNALTSSTNFTSTTSSPSQDSGNDLGDLRAQLEELRDLVEEGLITEDDYTRKKAELIEELD